MLFRSHLTGKIISIKCSEDLELNGLLDKLVNLGFERTDFVYEPGQFALRGGILDIYSYGNEKPYRIELFGNEVDSIRIFDPETQLSERKLLQVNIIPNVETKFDTAEKASLPDFFDEATTIWCHDWNFIKERVLLCEEELQLFLNSPAADSMQKEVAEDETNIRTRVDTNDFTEAAEIGRAHV